MKTCKSCESKEERLFAPFGEGGEDYCSDCQMEVENNQECFRCFNKMFLTCVAWSYYSYTTKERFAARNELARLENIKHER